MTTETITEFISARLDEDEAAATASAAHSGMSWEFRPDRGYEEFLSSVGVAGDRMSVVPCDPEDGPHIARHDPARTLREVAAKRAILAEHAHMAASYTVPQHPGMPPFGCTACARNDDGTIAPLGWCAHVRVLAAIDSDHPNYDPAWAPVSAERIAP